MSSYSSNQSVVSPVATTSITQYASTGASVEVPQSITADEVKRLKAAMNDQLQLNQRRERLASQLAIDRDLNQNRNEATVESSIIGIRSRISLINKITTSPISRDLPTSQLLTNCDIKRTSSTTGSIQDELDTPRAESLQKPAYPFSQLRASCPSSSSNRPLTALSPTVGHATEGFNSSKFDLRNTNASCHTRPTSEIPFRPTGAPSARDDSIFEAPNLYDISLMLSSESGLEAWWSTLVEIMMNEYGAHRATLSVPADSTDIENVPWGQKATFNILRSENPTKNVPSHRSYNTSCHDNLHESSSALEDISVKDDLGVFISSRKRPSLSSRHSFTSYEDTKRDPILKTGVDEISNLQSNETCRLNKKLSARTEYPPRTRTLQNARLYLKSLENHLVFENMQLPKTWENAEPTDREPTGGVFSVLQALDHEADPLIDNKGISRVLQRGKVIALTRDYPYIDSLKTNERHTGKKSCRILGSKLSGTDKAKTRSPDVSSRNTNFGHRSSRSSRKSAHAQIIDPATRFNEFIRADYGSKNEHEHESEHKYDEYEQAPASPWSQSPAPSPAVHVETSDNMFFTNMSAVDEETFNPKYDPEYYEGLHPQTIGADRSRTVLHIPLTHPLLSKPVQSFRLDAAALESRSVGLAKSKLFKYSADDERRPTSSPENKARQTPIAILSLLTPIIPYPSSLCDSLENLAPHLATTFSLCRHLTNLETEIAGLSRKRPPTIGFGAIIPGTFCHHTEDSLNLEHTTTSAIHDSTLHRYTAGSLTSPSDYSAFSKSNAGSPAGTPGWDSVNSNYPSDKRSSVGSTGCYFTDNHITNRPRPGFAKVDTGSTIRSLSGSKDPSSLEIRAQRVSRDVDERCSDNDPSSFLNDLVNKGQSAHDQNNINEEENRHHMLRDVNVSMVNTRDLSPCRCHLNDTMYHKRTNVRASSQQIPTKADRAMSMHTLLHSYGADFGSTFQPLPATTRCLNIARPRTYSCSDQTKESLSSSYMPPPSDRVKGILLDSLPLHLFIAIPPTGEVVWVNSRYLTYRGKSIDNLHDDPWGSIHSADREAYLKGWKHSLRTGEQFAMQARLQRFDGTYRWFYTRASGLRDSRGVVVQWHGTSMDIHEQHVAEVKAARQEEIEASEAKHRRLANLIPQIIFSATEEDGITFANHQWLSFTGQPFDDSIGLGFIDFIHPEDLAKCHVLIKESPLLSRSGSKRSPKRSQTYSTENSVAPPMETREKKILDTVSKSTECRQFLSRTNSSCSTLGYDCPLSDIAELIRSGAVKVEKDCNGQLSYSTEVRLRSKSGDYRWHLVRCVEVDDKQFGTRNGSWFGACADINNQKLLEMKLKDAMESKSKFLSNMSHEIRTPLLGISGMIDFLQDSELNDEQLGYCSTIYASAQTLLGIINDILDLAKADAGMAKLKYDWFHIRSLVEEVNEMLSTMAITKQLELSHLVDFDVPEMVKGDRFRIRQALLNVIGNAIKFTTIGEVFTHCKISPGRGRDYVIKENEIMLEFSVTDTGKGFTQEEADIIFKPFSQIDASSTRSQGGTGLGLVISRQLVELHGGKMEGTAIIGKGSTFTFTVLCILPTADDNPESPTTTKLNISSLSTPSKLSLAQTTTVSKASKPTTRYMSEEILVPKKSIQFSAGDSPMTSSSLDAYSVCSPDSMATLVHSDKLTPASHNCIYSDSRASSTYEMGSKPYTMLSPSLKLEIPVSSSYSTSARSKSLESSSIITSTNSQPNLDPRPKQTCDNAPKYSILLLCFQKHSCEATTQHIKTTLSRDIPYQITALSSIEETHSIFNDYHLAQFTHIVLNINSSDDTVDMVDKILGISNTKSSIVVLSDPLQRQSIMKKSTKYNYVELVKQNRITFVFKPIKPSRLAVIFDPGKERNLSTDLNRSSAEQHVASQRKCYLDMAKRLGNKGLKVLLVEDNAVNQKVLLKYLAKISIEVDLAQDGLECTEKVFQNPHSYYSLILCDLQMPNKDGYQACREIRAWETKETYNHMPIVALSANVMTDVVDRCSKAGFSDYITKPVDFKVLSKLIGDYLDPQGPLTVNNKSFVPMHET